MEDVRTTPDTISTIIEYPERFVFNYTTTVANAHYGLVERYIGTEGVIEIRDMKEMSIVVGDKEKTVKSTGLNNGGHMGNFFDCVRSRKTPVAPIDAGLQGAVCCHMAVISQQTGESVKWDSASERVVL
ncbi:MAG: hypothetical protein GY851_29860, partial [bacterium]|nr:hypothetical protein [bacterium]